MDSDVDNIVSIWTRKVPCDNIFLSNREFINLSSDAYGFNHISSCHDCMRRYSVINLQIYNSHQMSKNNETQ